MIRIGRFSILPLILMTLIAALGASTLFYVLVIKPHGLSSVEGRKTRSGATPIGRVERVTEGGPTGDVEHAVVMRNDLPVTLKVGHLVYKGDVVQTGAGSSIGIGFVDGSAFNLAANGRMVLSDMVYDPNGIGNSALISVIRGSVSFLAGQAAKTGDMRVAIPGATIRVNSAAIVLAEIGANNEPTKVMSMLDPTAGRVGEIVLLDRNDPPKEIGRLDDDATAILLASAGGLEVTVTKVPVTESERLAAQDLIRTVVDINAAILANPMVSGIPKPPPYHDSAASPAEGPRWDLSYEQRQRLRRAVEEMVPGIRNAELEDAVVFEIEQQIRSFGGFFNRPDFLIYRVPTEITAILQPLTMSEPDEILRTFEGAAEKFVLSVSKDVTVSLTGPKDQVEVTLRSGQEARRPIVGRSQWLWDVKALTTERVTLNLEVLAHLKIGAEATPLTISAWRHTLPVHVRLLDQIGIWANAVSPIWAALVALIGGLAACLAWWGIKPRWASEPTKLPSRGLVPRDD